MTNKELQEILKQYPDDAEIIRYIEYKDMNASWSGFEHIHNIRGIKFGWFKDPFDPRKEIKGLFICI